MRAAALVAAFPLVLCSCFDFTLGPTSTSSAGGQDGGASASTDDGGEGGSGVQGVNCGPDPDTGVVLCIGISSCPSLTVDQDLFPGCGFRVHPSAPDVIDLECACYGQICPIGITSSCDQASALMQDQSQYTVCMQVDEGRCTAN